MLRWRLGILAAVVTSLGGCWVFTGINDLQVTDEPPPGGGAERDATADDVDASVAQDRDAAEVERDAPAEAPSDASPEANGLDARADSGADADTDASTDAQADATPAIPGLVYHYPFNGNTNDSSGNGHHLTNSGATLTTDRHGTADAAYFFNGNAHMVASGASLPIGDSPRTITAWMKTTATQGQFGIIVWGQGDCQGLMFALGQNPTAASFWGGCNDATSTLPITPDVWTFVAVVYTPPTGITLWVNGSSQARTLGVTLATAASSLFVGGETSTNGVTYRNHYQGAFDDIRIFDRALSANEIDAIYRLP